MAKIQNPFSSALTRADFIPDAVASVVCPAGRFTELGRFIIVAGVAIALGHGELAGQDAAHGRIFADIRDAGTTPGLVINGLLRFDIHTPQDFVERTLWQERTENLRTSATDRQQQIPMPIIPDVVGEDWFLVMKFRPDATATVGRANTLLVVSATQFEVR